MVYRQKEKKYHVRSPNGKFDDVGDAKWITDHIKAGTIKRNYSVKNYSLPDEERNWKTLYERRNSIAGVRGCFRPYADNILGWSIMLFGFGCLLSGIGRVIILGNYPFQASSGFRRHFRLAMTDALRSHLSF